jgi:hypothetical protein
MSIGCATSNDERYQVGDNPGDNTILVGRILVEPALAANQHLRALIVSANPTISRSYYGGNPYGYPYGYRYGYPYGGYGGAPYYRSNGQHWAAADSYGFFAIEVPRGQSYFLRVISVDREGGNSDPRSTLTCTGQKRIDLGPADQAAYTGTFVCDQVAGRGIRIRVADQYSELAPYWPHVTGRYVPEPRIALDLDENNHRPPAPSSTWTPPPTPPPPPPASAPAPATAATTPPSVPAPAASAPAPVVPTPAPVTNAPAPASTETPK